MSQPERLVLELLLQQTIPDTIEAGGAKQLLTTLESKGLRPDAYPLLAAALTAIERKGNTSPAPTSFSPDQGDTQQIGNTEAGSFDSSANNNNVGDAE